MNLDGFEEISIRAIRSYDGLTFAFDSKSYFDLYYLYTLKNNQLEFLVGTKDLIVSLPELQEEEFYYVAGYRIENGEYVLKGKSELWECHPYPKIAPEKNPYITVVCPVYNAETCIANCIDSILLSTQDEMDMILVDDGSTDRSRDIIAWYQQAYPGVIKYYYQDNKGVSYARNKGIELAEGNFIGLIDNDDYVHPRMYEELLKAAIIENCPIAIGKTIIKAPDGTVNVVLNVPNEKGEETRSVSFEEMMRLKLKGDPNNIFFVAVWHKIIRADIVKQHAFPTSNHYEDTAYTRMIYSYIDRFAFAHNAYYIWDQRRRNTVGTASTTFYKSKSDDIYEIHKKFFDANFFGYEKGNPKRMDWTSYDLIKEVYGYLKKTNCLDKSNDLYKIVANQIKDHFMDLYLQNNPLMKQDKELLDFVNGIER